MKRRSLAQRIRHYQPLKEMPILPVVEGRLTRLIGLSLEAVGCNVTLGEHCLIQGDNGCTAEVEVVGFSNEKIHLMPLKPISGIQPGSVVIPMRELNQITVGDGLLGRVVDGLGHPIDGKGEIKGKKIFPVTGKVTNPLERMTISEPLDVGVRSINGLLTVGKGQRLGLFAGSGVGKSVLLGMMTRFTSADITVVALVGERGREVKEFIEESLGEEGLKRSVVVASPADDSPLIRLRAAMVATNIAEYYRDQGKNVLLLMDSLTRFAMAQREIALAIGEPPATKGYPPSVFAKIPQLVERAGNNNQANGSITAFYTVLTEGDDQQDPVADAARAILDGHIVLSRQLAEEGQYPAIDIEGSISRAMPSIVSESHLNNAQRLKQIYARYQQNKDLISIGAYTPGSDDDIDYAIDRMPHIRRYFQQSTTEQMLLENSVEELNRLLQAMPVVKPPADDQAVVNA